jgi:hypothetical protein
VKITISTLRLAIALLLSSSSFVGINAQTQSGIFGNKHLVGYKADFLLAPFSPVHHLYVEQMTGRRTNIGLSVFTNKTNYSLDDKSTYISSYQDIILKHQGKDRLVRAFDATMTQRKTGFEIYIKRFSKRNQMRNYGLFWSYKFGQIRSVNSLKTGSIVYVQDTLNQYENEKLRVSDPGRNVTTSTYVAFELGRTVPFYHDRMLLTYSATFNGFLTGLQEIGYRESFDSYLQIEANNNINNTHILTFNVGLSYAF